MLGNLKSVFFRLREVNLKVNPKKCNFFDRHVKYLAHSFAGGCSDGSGKDFRSEGLANFSYKKAITKFSGILVVLS